MISRCQMNSTIWSMRPMARTCGPNFDPDQDYEPFSSPMILSMGGPRLPYKSAAEPRVYEAVEVSKDDPISVIQSEGHDPGPDPLRVST